MTSKSLQTIYSSLDDEYASSFFEWFEPVNQGEMELEGEERQLQLEKEVRESSNFEWMKNELQKKEDALIWGQIEKHPRILFLNQGGRGKNVFRQEHIQFEKIEPPEVNWKRILYENQTGWERVKMKGVVALLEKSRL